MGPLLPYSFENPGNPGDYLGFGTAANRPNEFAAYDEFDPRAEVFVDPANGFVFTDPTTEGAVPFVLNFLASDGEPTTEDGVYSDGSDALFGDLGNDWLVGGTLTDRLYGGFGFDLLNADDDHNTGVDEEEVGLNTEPDPFASYADIAYGGAGRDVLIANTGGDRLLDWVGEYNALIVPFAPFGAFTVSRTVQPQTPEYLYDLSAADGADPTRIVDGVETRNGEPYGELGLVIQQDPFWQDQTGAPDDPQPGNIPGGQRDTMAAEDFNSDASLTAFAADFGSWSLKSGKLVISPETLGEDAVSVYHLQDALPGYFEIQATINGGKPIQGLKSNAYVVFDYQGPTDFKFAGVNISTDKLEIGHRDASGWQVDVQTPSQLKPETAYNVKVAVNGTNVAVLVNGTDFMTYTFAPRVVDGLAYGINSGLIGLGSNNSVAKLDNLAVQVLPPELTYELNEDFSDDVADLFTGVRSGDWSIQNAVYVGAPTASDPIAYSLVDLSAELGLPSGTFALDANAFLRLSANLTPEGIGGFIFDYAGPNRFKFAAFDAESKTATIGHFTERDGWTIDAAFAVNGPTNQSREIELSLKGSTVSLKLDGNIVASHSFNAVVVDGPFGVLSTGGSTAFDDVVVATDDWAFRSEQSETLNAPVSADNVTTSLTQAQLSPIVAAAAERWGIELNDFNVQITDLPDRLLGLVSENSIQIDINAAGHGWFVDETPGDDREFVRRLDDGALQATPNSLAYGRIDLLTVVLHELGHVMGLDHSVGQGFHVMQDELGTGVRLVPVSSTGAPSASESGAVSNTSAHVFDEERDSLVPLGDYKELKRLVFSRKLTQLIEEEELTLLDILGRDLNLDLRSGDGLSILDALGLDDDGLEDKNALKTSSIN